MDLFCPSCKKKLNWIMKNNNYKCQNKKCNLYNRYQFSAKVEEE